MKKFIFLLLLMIINPLNILAYSNDYFEIELNEEFKKTNTDNELAFKWISDTKSNMPSIVITIEKNNSSTPYNINSYSDEELKIYKKQIEDKMIKSLEEYDIEITVSDIKTTLINNLNSMYYTLYWPTKDSYGYDMYQRSYVFTTKKYVTTFIYSTTDEKEYETTKFKDLLNGLKIKDTSFEDYHFFDSILNRIVVAGILGGTIGFIISSLIKKKRK